mmetsp:Transcript_31540/g.36415  ORF Transcript_31540/g.36415 Transcript_31540/m.36415 type:complete len:1025 (+) Transcript_31540:604-3678(+)
METSIPETQTRLHRTPSIPHNPRPRFPSPPNALRSKDDLCMSLQTEHTEELRGWSRQYQTLGESWEIRLEDGMARKDLEMEVERVRFRGIIEELEGIVIRERKEHGMELERLTLRGTRGAVEVPGYRVSGDLVTRTIIPDLNRKGSMTSISLEDVDLNSPMLPPPNATSTLPPSYSNEGLFYHSSVQNILPVPTGPATPPPTPIPQKALPSQQGEVTPHLLTTPRTQNGPDTVHPEADVNDTVQYMDGFGAYLPDANSDVRYGQGDDGDPNNLYLGQDVTSSRRSDEARHVPANRKSSTESRRSSASGGRRASNESGSRRASNESGGRRASNESGGRRASNDNESQSNVLYMGEEVGDAQGSMLRVRSTGAIAAAAKAVDKLVPQDGDEWNAAFAQSPDTNKSPKHTHRRHRSSASTTHTANTSQFDPDRWSTQALDAPAAVSAAALHVEAVAEAMHPSNLLEERMQTTKEMEGHDGGSVVSVVSSHPEACHTRPPLVFPLNANAKPSTRTLYKQTAPTAHTAPPSADYETQNMSVPEEDHEEMNLLQEYAWNNQITPLLARLASHPHEASATGEGGWTPLHSLLSQNNPPLEAVTKLYHANPMAVLQNLEGDDNGGEGEHGNGGSTLETDTTPYNLGKEYGASEEVLRFLVAMQQQQVLLLQQKGMIGTSSTFRAALKVDEENELLHEEDSLHDDFDPNLNTTTNTTLNNTNNNTTLVQPQLPTMDTSIFTQSTPGTTDTTHPLQTSDSWYNAVEHSKTQLNTRNENDDDMHSLWWESSNDLQALALQNHHHPTSLGGTSTLPSTLPNTNTQPMPQLQHVPYGDDDGVFTESLAHAGPTMMLGGNGHTDTVAHTPRPSPPRGESTTTMNTHGTLDSILRMESHSRPRPAKEAGAMQALMAGSNFNLENDLGQEEMTPHMEEPGDDGTVMTKWRREQLLLQAQQRSLMRLDLNGDPRTASRSATLTPANSGDITNIKQMLTIALTIFTTASGRDWLMTTCSNVVSEPKRLINSPDLFSSKNAIS